MPRIQYKDWNPSAESLAVVLLANRFIQEYEAAGYSLTLRQLYYRFVASDAIPNTQQSYKRLGSILNDARMAGLVDWEAIEDRTRNLQALSHWSSPAEIVRAAVNSYRRNLWDGQHCRVEVWVEKDALVDVVGRAAEAWDVPYFACRGYVSQSEMWAAAQRLVRYVEDDGHQQVVVLHLGDHDPSGIDMTRDIQDRLDTFTEGMIDLQVRRIALNMPQVEEHEPPPNPAKLTDSRSGGYVERYGYDSWELDALEPAVLDELIQGHIQDLLEYDRFRQEQHRSEDEQKQLQWVSANFDTIMAGRRKKPKP